METEVQKIELLNAQSEEIQEVVGKQPPTIIRWGMASIFGIVLLSLVLAYKIEYNETVVSEVKLISKNPPAKILANSDGRIKSILISEGSKVEQGQVIGYLETTASVHEVYRMKEMLEYAYKNIQNDNWKKVIDYPFNDFSNLGELQPAFQTFISAYLPLKFFLRDHIYDKKLANIQTQLITLDKTKLYLDTQRAIYQKDYNISQQDFSAKSFLFNEKVISLLEFQQEKSKLLLKESPIINNSNAKIALDRDISTKKYELTELDQQMNNYKLNYHIAVNSLIEAIKQWEKQYVFKAPVAGTIDMPTLLFKNKYLKAGEEIVSIHQDGKQFYGEALLNQQNFGKVKLNQNTIIKVDGYPFQEFGKLIGEISFLAQNANDANKYYVAISLPNTLETDKKIVINIQNGMTGTMEIITKKTRLLNRIIYSLTDLIDAATHKKVKK